MTFSVTGRCARTGMAGVAITTSSICVGSRCPHVRAGVGAVATQNVTLPSLGPDALDAMAAGASAAEAVERAIAGDRFPDHRQLAAVDLRGTTACHTGARILGTHAVAHGDGCVAAGNLLSSEAVPGAMRDYFDGHQELHLAERLLGALEAGVAAGGEEGPTHSSALLVADRQRWPLVDLRCDWDDADPVAVLRRLWAAYAPQIDPYTARALDPDAAPSYGVPGDV